MGRRGPAKTPTKILAARGSWRAKTRKGEPQPKAGRPTCPKRLSPQAAIIWKSLMPQLEAAGVLTKIDGRVLARYCELSLLWTEMQKRIADEGTVQTAEGVERDLPTFNQALKLHDRLLRIEQQFGMTPSARANMAQTVDSPDKENRGKDHDRFFNPQFSQTA